ncbi:MAG: hypothetical protein CMJ16_04750 [Peredibacter sp.]|nr:hypothetical protein [Peredibacter sp.]|tara:strand:- start:207 stop:584 length:378 start_codon:yes stop_codon:yes gene_type:complete
MKKFIAFILTTFSTAAISNTELNEIYSQVSNGKAIIVDVREKSELEQGMVKGAVWLPLSKVKSAKEWEKEIKKLAKDKNIFLYCRSGSRAELVRKMLENKGIEAKNIGGFKDLKKAFPIERGTRF